MSVLLSKAIKDTNTAAKTQKSWTVLQKTPDAVRLHSEELKRPVSSAYSGCRSKWYVSNFSIKRQIERQWLKILHNRQTLYNDVRVPVIIRRSYVSPASERSAVRKVAKCASPLQPSGNRTQTTHTYFNMRMLHLHSHSHSGRPRGT